MGGQQHLDPEIARQVPQDRKHLAAPGRVEPGGRLVEHDQIGAVHQRLGQLGALPHTERVGVHQPVSLLREPDREQHLRRPPQRIPPRQPAQPRQVDAQVLRRHVGREAGVLGQVAHPRTDLPAVGQPEHLHLPGIGDQQPERHLHQRGLAGAVRAEQAGGGRRHVDRHAV
ncbi:MAG: hypothetical protein WD794_08905 [Mycobacteriales bacterium]